jgi:hypothetical protein
VKTFVLADQLFNMCHEDGEELVWLKGELGDEMSSVSQVGVDSYRAEIMRDLETEKEYRYLLTNLPL